MPTLLAQSDVDLSGLTATDWIVAGVTLAVTIVATLGIRRLATGVLERFELGPGPVRLVSRFVASLVFIGGVVYVLNSLGIPIGPLLGALGVGGLALAFALQDIVENLIAGLMLQARRPFTIGDQVVAGGYEGEVEDITLRTTVLHTYDGRRVFVPSADVIKSGIENNTAFDRRRTTLGVGVAYDTDLDMAQQTILQAVASADGTLDDPAPQAYVEAFGGSSIDFAVRFWHDPRIAELWRVRHRVAVSIKGHFDDAGIEIPFPIRTLELGTSAATALGRTESSA